MQLSSLPARRVALGAGVVALSVAGLAGLASSALFTSTDFTSADTYVTGTVVLSTAGTAEAISLPNMAPGDSASRKFVVKNDGSLQYRYAVSSTSTGAELSAAAVAVLVSGTCDKPGDELYKGSLADLRLGDKKTGADEGDRVLAAATDESLCLTVSLPTATGNDLQGKSNATTLTFDAEQTANN